MRFALSEDQKMLQESLMRTLSDASPLNRVRKFADDPADAAADVWAALSDFGLPGIADGHSRVGAGGRATTPADRGGPALSGALLASGGDRPPPAPAARRITRYAAPAPAVSRAIATSAAAPLCIVTRLSLVIVPLQARD